jgi:hypothetical protein
MIFRDIGDYGREERGCKSAGKNYGTEDFTMLTKQEKEAAKRAKWFGRHSWGRGDKL